MEQIHYAEYDIMCLNISNKSLCQFCTDIRFTTLVIKKCSTCWRSKHTYFWHCV